MASLSGVSVASSYTSLLKLNGNTDTLVAGASGAGIQVVDGDGTGSPLYLNTDRLGVGVAPSHELTVNNQIGIKRDGVDTFATMTFDGSGFTLDNSASSITPLTVKAGGAFLARITGDGALGIGTSSPQQKLDVRGSLNSAHAMFSGQDSRGLLIETQATTSNDDTVVLNAQASSGEMVLETNSTERMRLTSTGLGIGVSPDTTMHIHKATAGTVDSNANAQLTIENNSHAGIQFLSPVSANNIIYFGNNTDNDVAYIGYIHSSNDLQFFINGGVRLQLDANSRISLSNNTGFDGGTSNTVFGKNVGTIDAGSNYNVFIGEDVATENTLADATQNTMIGYRSGHSLTSGDSNCFYGRQTGLEMQDGSENTFIGMNAGATSVSGTKMVAVGVGAMGTGNVTADATGTVSLGYDSLKALTTGSGNTAVGYLSLQSVDDGSKCTAVGFQAGNTTEGATKSTFIGYDTEGSGANVNNETVIGSDAVGQGANSVVLGNADVTAVYMAQDSGAKVHMGDFHLQNSTSFTFNDNASHELCSFEARYTDSPTGTTGAHIAFRSSADDFTSGTETARIANIGTSGNISSNHSSSLEFHVISAHTMTKTLTVGSSDGNDRVQLHKGRLQFPATQNADSDANTLDDYEEGTWTPIVKDFQGTPVAFTAGSGNAGTYTKVGRMVTCNALCVTSADNSASGFVAIHGLPFAPASGNRTAVTFGNYENLAITAGHSINGNIYDTNQFIGLYVADATGGSTNMSVAEWSPDGRAYLSVTYFTD